MVRRNQGPRTPPDLAIELGIDPKTLRAWLRKTFPRSRLDHGQPWWLSPDQVAAARGHFGGGVRSTGSQERREPSFGESTNGSGSTGPERRALGPVDALRLRRESAERFRPEKVRLLLVAEAPPRSRDRYFYFRAVSAHDSLFRYVVKGLYGFTPDRVTKPELLQRLSSDGVYLIDLSEAPEGVSDLRGVVPGLIARCRALRPEAIVVIKTRVYDAAFASLRSAGLPVVDRRIPFPGSGQQQRFEEEFAKALVSVGWKTAYVSS